GEPALRPDRGTADHVPVVARALHVPERRGGPVQADHVHLVAAPGQALGQGVGDPLDAAERVGVQAGEDDVHGAPPKKSATILAEASPCSSAHHSSRKAAYRPAWAACTASRSRSFPISSSVVVTHGPGAMAGRSW